MAAPKRARSMVRRRRGKYVDEMARSTLSIVLDHLRSEGRESIEDEELTAILKDATLAALPEMGKIVVEALEKRSDLLLRDRRRDFERFQSSINKRWGPALNQLEFLLHAFMEFGESYYHHGMLRPFNQKSKKSAALVRLHARACRVSLEILTLLRSGLSDGAHARWRTLHEIAVVAFVLAESDEERARRYFLHRHIQNHKAALKYQEHCRALGYQPLTKRELDRLQKHRDKLRAEFGKDFASDYGWACGLCGIERPTFADLEQAVSLELYRPIYAWASDGVHAGPKGLSSIGLPDNNADILLAGATNAGLADPGRNTAITLSQIATALMSARVSLDYVVMVEALLILARRCQEEFMNAHWKLEGRISATPKRRRR